MDGKNKIYYSHQSSDKKNILKKYKKKDKKKVENKDK